MSFNDFQVIAQKLFSANWKPYVMIACGVSQRTIDRWQSKGRVPKPVESWILAFSSGRPQ